MLEPLLGSVNRERVLLYIHTRDEGYPRQIARFFQSDLGPIQNQLDKLEEGGVLYSRMAGKTRLFSFNPRYAFLNELKNLLDKTLSFYPVEERDTFFESRRPRRGGMR